MATTTVQEPMASLLVTGPQSPCNIAVDRLSKADECAESNYTIKAFDFASRYCVSCGNSANPRPNLKTDTRLMGTPT